MLGPEIIQCSDSLIFVVKCMSLEHGMQPEIMDLSGFRPADQGLKYIGIKSLKVD